MEGGILTSGLPASPYEGLLVLAMVSVLFFMVVALSAWKRLGLGRDMSVGFILGGAQLALVSVLLTALIEWSSQGTLWLPGAALLVGAMAAIAGRRSSQRSPDMPRSFTITAVSISLGAVLSLSVLLLAGAMPLRPEFVIPLAGMAFGNCMGICSLTLERITREFRMNRGVIEARLSLGASSSQAMEETGRMAMRAALIPTIDRMKTLGIIFIPGAMAGLLMAGVEPLVAAQFQLVIFLMIVGGGIVTTLSVATLSRGSFFNELHQIEEWV